jgi:hypothetical protein
VSDLRRIIGEAVGEASLQWEPKPSGIFDSSAASALVDRTVAQLAALEAENAKLKRVLARIAADNYNCPWPECYGEQELKPHSPGCPVWAAIEDKP